VINKLKKIANRLKELEYLSSSQTSPYNRMVNNIKKINKMRKKLCGKRLAMKSKGNEFKWLNYTFGPRVLTNSRKWSCLFQIEQNRP